MEKNSEFIKNKEFHVVFKGYNPEEVDKFLDILSIEFERLIKKNRELQESLDRVKFESSEEEDTDIKKIIQDALISAHKVADDIKSQARREAEEMVAKIKQDQEQALGNLKIKKINLEESTRMLQTKYEEFKNKILKELEDINKLVAASEVEYIFGFNADTGKENESIETADIGNIGETAETGETADIGDIGETAETGEIADIGDTGETEETAGIEDIGETGETAGDEVAADLKMEADKIETEDSDVSLKHEDLLRQSREEASTQEGNTDLLNQPERFSGSDKSLIEKNTRELPENGLKRERKKIDIANPDIIENFFRTNND